MAKISEKGYDFVLGRIYFTVDDGCQNFLVLAPMLSSLTLDSNFILNIYNLRIKYLTT